MKHAALFMATIFLFSALAITGIALKDADARARRGGRSFSSRSTPPPIRRSTPPPVRGSSSRARNSSGGLMSGLAGGVMGGMLGSMLFGGMAHGMGGGLGGSGLGLLDILIIGGIIWFIYTRFVKKKGAMTDSANNSDSFSHPRPDLQTGQENYTGGLDAPPSAGSASTPPPPMPDDDTELTELAQDIFFKIQAAWMHRDIETIKQLTGSELAAFYERELQAMKNAGRINKLENIAVRKVEVIGRGKDDGHEFVKIRFTANLLDYTIDEATGKTVEGDNMNPVKFQETWTIARPYKSNRWLLYGIDS